MDRCAPRRRPSEGGYARGEETRLRIIATAIPLFGEKGFDGVSTREIAAAAGVNPPALQYYFDSKEGLYRACAEHMAESAAQALDPSIGRAERLLQEDAPARALVDAYCAITESVVDLMFGQAGPAGWSQFLATEEAGFGPGTAFPLLRARFLDRMEAVFAALVGRLVGKRPDDPEPRLRAVTINGQLQVFSFGRRKALAALGWDSVEGDKIHLVRALVVEQTRALLTYLAVRAAKAGGDFTPTAPTPLRPPPGSGL
jgi:AcrR family transcriptional regulator